MARPRCLRSWAGVAGKDLQVEMMRELPQELAALDEDELVVQRVTRDERLAALFRRWPKLAGRELRELRRLYDERLRLARHVGRIRAARRK